MSEPSSLAAENRAIHDGLEERLLVLYERLTELDLDGARATFAGFVAALETHMACEEAWLLPALARLVPEHRGERDTLVQQVEGDHTILVRTVAKVDELLGRLTAGPRLRREVVQELDTCLLLRRVLEHHTQRETERAYPLLDAHLAPDERDAVRAALRAAVAA